MSPFEWVVALTIVSIVLSLDYALIKVIVRASGDFTEMVKQMGQMVHFLASVEREVKHLAKEFGELAFAIEDANGVERLSDETHQKLKRGEAPGMVGGDD